MRTNIVIDETLMANALRAGHFKTKKDAVEAGLRLVARQAAYQEILKWEGKLHWDDGAASAPNGPTSMANHLVMEPGPVGAAPWPSSGLRTG